MFKRDILTQLLAWKESEKRKPLILRGARQVGKTTVVNEFGKSYDNYLYYNLEDESNKALFELGLPINDLINLLFSRSNKERKGKTLLFIDEIQNSPKTMSMLRYFYEQHPDLHVIVAGSLLENVVDMKASFPVGRVEYLPVRPCSFAEFARVLGKQNLLDIICTPSLSHPFHTELISLFNQYVIVGGMPEVVQEYANNRDVLALDNYYESLLQAYRDDVEKYTRTNKLTEIVRYILKYGWSKAGETIKLTSFADSSYKSREVGEAFRLLEKAMLLELVYPTSSPNIPLIPSLKRSPKLIWFDTGLMNYAAGVRKAIIGTNDILDVWRGHIAEQVVAQELLTLNTHIGQKRFFWSKGNGGNSAEIDFVWQVDSTLVPIEVKSGHNSKLRSLHTFLDESTSDVAVRIWSGEFSIDELVTTSGRKHFKLVNLPFYLVGQLENIIRQV